MSERRMLCGAFSQGDASRAKIVEADAAVYETSSVAQDTPLGKYW